MRFCERLRQLRENAGLTQAAVWEQADIPRKTYLNYEQGYVAAVPFTAVLAIAKVLGVDCTAFADCEYTSVAEPQAEEPEAKSPDARPMGKRK